MPRQARIDTPGALHHIMVRGIERKKIFRDNKARERFERKYELKAQGYNLDVLARRIAEIFDVTPEEILSPGKYKERVQARSVFSYWAVRELGETASNIAKKIGISQPAVSQSVERGERIVKEMGLEL